MEITEILIIGLIFCLLVASIIYAAISIGKSSSDKEHLKEREDLERKSQDLMKGFED